MTTRQRGGTIVGFIFGLIVGLGVALAVVVYVMKVPVPFITKGGLRGPGAALETRLDQGTRGAFAIEKMR